jgi:translocation and assembly module TamA
VRVISSVEVTQRASRRGRHRPSVKLEPAPTHTIAGELGYGNGRGLRAEASWQDRKLQSLKAR